MAEKPEKIGHYTIVSQLGRGGMGIVYKAREESLNRFVAIKVLTEQLTEDSTFLQRFVREAQAAAGLSHPNIVNIYFIGEDHGHPYFVMEYVTGRSLHGMVKAEGRIGNPRAAQVILQAAHGLAAAHDKGIIHRDIKPANLMLDERGNVKIADFGLALPADAEMRLTATGMLMGTPGYLAPEQCRGEKVDHRTDIYALGVTFYELLAGILPFRGESPLALLRQILDEEAPDIAMLNPDVDADTRRILARMIAKEREQRYQDCHQVVADLEDYLASHGVRSMTAGLSTHKSMTTPGLAAAAAMAATTQALGSQAAKVTSPTMKVTSPTTPEATPTALVQSVEAAPTRPVAPLVEPDTIVPGRATIPSIPVPPPPSRSSSRALVLVLVLAVVLGGGTAAAFLAMKMLRGGRQESAVQAGSPGTVVPGATETGATGASTMSGTNPPQGVLLAQGMNAATPGSRVEGTPLAQASGQTGDGAAQQGSPGPAAASTTRSSPGPAAASTTRSSPGPAAADRRPVAEVVREAGAGRARAASALSGVGVAVTGDPGLTGAVSSVLTSELEATGLQVVDAQTLPSTEDLLRGGDVSAARLIDRLRDEGLAVLVLARVEPSGERQLSYLGRQETAYSARITLTTYDLATGKPFGSRGNATMEYTTRTADRESEKVVGRLARSTAEAIQKR